MVADEDLRRLYESRHDIGALTKIADLTDNKPMQHAAAASRDELTERREALRTAAGTMDREHNETDAERLRLAQVLTASIRRYGYIRGKVQDALINVDPEEPLAQGELERRQRLFGRVFGATPSDLERVGQGVLIEKLGQIAQALATDPDLAPLKHAASMKAAHSTAVDVAHELNRETDEDAAAMKALRAAREAFDRAASAHALLIDSILVRQDRAADLGRFLLADDPAYAARRAARTPIAQEPGADDATSPLPTPPTPPPTAGG